MNRQFLICAGMSTSSVITQPAAPGLRLQRGYRHEFCQFDRDTKKTGDLSLGSIRLRFLSPTRAHEMCPALARIAGTHRILLRRGFLSHGELPWVQFLVAPSRGE